MTCFYRSTVSAFLKEENSRILTSLEAGYANRGYTTQYSEQTLVWLRDIETLRCSLRECVTKSTCADEWGVLLEFSIPRKEQRIDAVLLVRNTIVLLEAKSTKADSSARKQIEEYALLLHYFHKASANHRIMPIIISPFSTRAGVGGLGQPQNLPQMARYWIQDVTEASWEELPARLLAAENSRAEQISHQLWDRSPYFPVPTIIEAAIGLRSGLAIREIAHSEASEREIDEVVASINEIVHSSQRNNEHSICFITGVPGSGKTLIGLSLAHSDLSRADTIHFMSGNGPLVKVLQHVFTREGMRSGLSALDSRTRAKTLIENVHVFARYHTEDNQGSPSNHAIVFDEAQRAWNRKQNKRKFGRDYSEPEMLLHIRERHKEWAVVVALVGGGQEINDGEAGLEEWGKAISNSNKDWKIYASPEVLEGGTSTAGHKLFDRGVEQKDVLTRGSLHLRTSTRSLRAENLATWVNHVLDGNAESASSLQMSTKFPILLTRDLYQTRRKLAEQCIGSSRYGLTGSSGALRLRSEGLEPSSSFHAEYPWEHWYLAAEKDVRSSYRCEVFATEFEIQGLELDWVGVCWGGDLVWSNELGWQLRTLRHGPNTTWKTIKNAEKRIYRKNAYRVLLTRARQGMIVFVPQGDPGDPTVSPAEFDDTANFLIRCGALPLQQ